MLALLICVTADDTGQYRQLETIPVSQRRFISSYVERPWTGSTGLHASGAASCMIAVSALNQVILLPLQELIGVRSDFVARMGGADL